jgi:hypothetical protein
MFTAAVIFATLVGSAVMLPTVSGAQGVENPYELLQVNELAIILFSRCGNADNN